MDLHHLASIGIQPGVVAIRFSARVASAPRQEVVNTARALQTPLGLIEKMPLSLHCVEDSEFRCFVVPEEERDAIVRTLVNATLGFHRDTLHHTLAPPGSPCIHVVSAGGKAPPDVDGEPEGAKICVALVEELEKGPSGIAVVVWRRFGGTLLGVRSGVLQGSYRHVAREAITRYTITNSAKWDAFFGHVNKAAPSAAPLAAGVSSRLEGSNHDLQPNRAAWEPLVLPLPIPCVCYDQNFLSEEEARRFFKAFNEESVWETGNRVKHFTALHGEVEYSYKAGYASDTVLPWTPMLLELKSRIEAWLSLQMGVTAKFNICLLNKYDNGKEKIGWHADREEIDPRMDAPRASPIASISLGTERLFGFAPKGDSVVQRKVIEAAGKLNSTAPYERRAGMDSMTSLGYPPIRLAHGSLCVMENACQLLYKHSLLPEQKADGVRINLTFRAKHGVELAAQPLPVKLPPSISDRGEEGAVFVGLTSGLDHCAKGWKDTLFHPFESPFVEDAPGIAACRYQTWLLAQPVFSRWVCEQLRGRKLLCGGGLRDAFHSLVLGAIAARDV